MSKRLVGVHNFTDKKVVLGSRRRDRRGVNDGSRLFDPKQKVNLGNDPNWDIPDNSDSSKYFDTHRVDVFITKPQAWDSTGDFTYWNDDHDKYKIKYCKNGDWRNTTEVMPGGAEGKDGSQIILHVSEPRPGQYQVAAMALEDRGRIELATAFKNFKTTTGMRAGQKYTTDQIISLMQHPSFGAVKDHARDNGFKSIALVAGAEGSFVVGGEAFSGVLMGLDGGGTYFFKSTSVSIGIQEGVNAFVGTYLSNEEPSKVGGFEFFAELSLGLGVGFSFSMFATLGHGGGCFVALTNGEELEFSLGVGWASTSKIG